MGLRRTAVALWLVAFVLSPRLLGAQPPHHEWRTLETASYRVHYPAEFEGWAMRTAAVLESVRARVAEEVGFAPGEKTDVVVMDPAAEANGFAVPLLGAPRMVLWTNPPPPDSTIGHFRSWPELLATHEDVHLVHLMRPSRNPLQRFLERTLLPLGPIARRSPRWVVEGYATLLEGQLTGSGRPFGDLRAAILRRWAQRGWLPSYRRLAYDTERWQGMSMAYLAGSAYLEWLREARGPDSLRHLWARLSARTSRSFDDAFAGVFGGTPEELYGRFTAEVTERSMAIERSLEPHVRDGELWQRLEWTTGVPAVSPDGQYLAIVLRDRERPARLVVWTTGPDEERERERRDRIDRMLERDPQDVAPVRDRPLPRRAVHALPAIDGADPEAPRWMPDGASILFVRVGVDADGVRRPDLFRWHIDAGRVERVTRLADVRAPDPEPDGQHAIAVRHRHGRSQMVRVHLATGAVTPITEPSLDIVYGAPRVSPGGGQLAYQRHAGGEWRLVVRDLRSGQERELETPRGATIAHPSWSRDGRTLFAAVGERGFVDVVAHPVSGEKPYAVTRTPGAGLGPEPLSAEALFFLSLEPHGFDLRLAPIEPAPAVPAEAMRPTLVPVVPPLPPAAEPPAQHDIAPGRPYGVGRQELMPLVGGFNAPSGRILELGGRGGDLLGRLSYLGMASIARGRGVREGGAVAVAWRGWPVTLRSHASIVDERPSAQPATVPGLGTALDARQLGVELSAGWIRQTALQRSASVLGGAFAGRVDPADGTALGRRAVFGEGRYAARPSRGDWHWQYSTALRFEQGWTGDDSWRRLGALVQAGLGFRRASIGVALDRRHVSGHPTVFDRMQIGGFPASVLPPSLAAGRVSAPALPLATLVGDRIDRQRIDVHGVGPLPVFLERYRAWNAGERPGDWLRVFGTEVEVSTGPIPLVRLPAPVFRFGAARVLDPPFERTNRWWIALVWRP